VSAADPTSPLMTGDRNRRAEVAFVTASAVVFAAIAICVAVVLLHRLGLRLRL
jgi:hypothetical protein